ncbi:hypothetical protein C8R48DRAFT_775076 [Suillus tomentosus]|nr:hypothetical protein C8R48DRAFT_775076 [Suillus tomentosus]
MNPMSWFKWVRNQLGFLVLKVSILSVAACNPSWFTASPVSYKSNLNCLTVSILRDAAQRIGFKRSDARLKTKSVDAILQHFEGLRTELASSSPEELTQHFSMHLPITSLQTRVALIAAAVDDAYGANVAAALRRSPVSLATSLTPKSASSETLGHHKSWLHLSNWFGTTGSGRWNDYKVWASYCLSFGFECTLDINGDIFSH